MMQGSLLNAADLTGTAAAARPGAPRAVAVLIGQLAQGGSERQLYMFLAHCDRTRWTPTVYVSGQLGFWEGPIRALGIPVVLLVGHRVAKMRQLRAACAAQGATCLFSWSSYTNPFGLALLGTGIRRVGSYRNAMFADLPTRLRSIWAWASLAGISAAVCNSRDTFEQLSSRRALRPKATYVPNGVEAPSPSEVAALRAQWRSRLGLQEDTVLIMGVGRLASQKRFDRFLDIIDKVKTDGPVQAVIAGADLGCRCDLERQIEGLGLDNIVRLIGTVPDARELICAADIFLLTSDHEGTPNVILEAMAAGRPCVATRVNGVGELIEDGVTGFTATPDASELARHVSRLVADPDLRRRVGEAARRAVGRTRSPTEIAHRLWSLCE
jgi:glycosyltransferase involved in cell wall biosynthesis